MILINGEKHWTRNGKLHREDGPAFIDADGNKEWHLSGKKYKLKHWNKITNYYSDEELVELILKFE